jgi:hypothetical protein
LDEFPRRAEWSAYNPFIGAELIDTPCGILVRQASFLVE